MGLHFDTSEQTCEYVRSQTDRVVLAFSTGKDSIAAWLQLRKFWTEPGQIVPIYNSGAVSTDGLRNLGFVAKTLAYYEQIFQTKIYSIPHPGFIRQLRYGMYCSPELLPMRDQLVFQYKAFPEYTANDLNEWLIKNIAELENAWFATGIRAKDNLTRRRTIQGQGSVHPMKRKFFPVWDWSIDRLEDELRANNVKLPIDYHWWKRSFDDISYTTTEKIREHVPDDYEAIHFWFPLVDTDAFRHACLEQLNDPELNSDPDYIFCQ